MTSPTLTVGLPSTTGNSAMRDRGLALVADVDEDVVFADFEHLATDDFAFLDRVLRGEALLEHLGEGLTVPRAALGSGIPSTDSPLTSSAGPEGRSLPKLPAVSTPQLIESFRERSTNEKSCDHPNGGARSVQTETT